MHNVPGDSRRNFLLGGAALTLAGCSGNASSNVLSTKSLAYINHNCNPDMPCDPGGGEPTNGGGLNWTNVTGYTSDNVSNVYAYAASGVNVMTSSLDSSAQRLWLTTPAVTNASLDVNVNTVYGVGTRYYTPNGQSYQLIDAATCAVYSSSGAQMGTVHDNGDGTVTLNFPAAFGAYNPYTTSWGFTTTSSGGRHVLSCGGANMMMFVAAGGFIFACAGLATLSLTGIGALIAVGGFAFATTALIGSMQDQKKQCHGGG